MQNSKVKLTAARAEDHVVFNLVMHWSQAVVFGMRVTTAQFCSGLDTFEEFYDEGPMTKNQPITMLVLLGESLSVQQ